MTLLLRYLLGLIGLGQNTITGGEPPVEPPEPPGGDGGITVTTDGPIPKVLPKEVVEAIARCACCRDGSGSGSGSDGDGDGDGDGSGSGSGSDGRITCCQCPSWPATLQATVTASHIGTRTITLNRITSIDCNDDINEGDNLKIRYTGAYLDPAELEFASAIDCITGVPFSVTPTPYTESWEVFLDCVICGVEVGSSIHNWVVYVRVTSHTGGIAKTANYLRQIGVVSCDPNTFASVTDTIVCEDDTTEDPVCTGEGTGGLLLNKNEPWTDFTNGVGETFELDISV